MKQLFWDSGRNNLYKSTFNHGNINMFVTNRESFFSHLTTVKEEKNPSS